ncbi:MAG TPA: DNA-processing protein DprA [Pyrinomonadaceae bacterium]|nr:DNA-processing protein DprA [Pyrinomonadaceae bacterium]
MNLNSESLTLILLTSHLALHEQPNAKPLSAREWTQLELKLTATSVAISNLLGWPVEQIQATLQIHEDEASRLARLLDRSTAVQQEVARLESLGIWVLIRDQEDYPPRLRERLRDAAPVVLYGSGDANLLKRRGVAIVGSRNIDARGIELTELIGSACAESNLVVFSGGARGVDKIAMGRALRAGGSAAGLLADSLEKALRASDAQVAIEEGRLVLATPYVPSAGFNVGMAMARNKLIYSLADFAIVIASDAGKGGTWAGAEEAIKAGWVPVFAVDGPDSPEGNQLLIKRGAIPLPASLENLGQSLEACLEEYAAKDSAAEAQGTLF